MSRRAPAAAPPQPARDDLEQRVAHLERVLEALEDAVHREMARRDEQFAHLQRKTKPEELVRALGADARKRGL